jgi:transposase-like protein
VEVDETFFGSPEKGRPGRGGEKKALIAIAVELKEPRLGRCRMTIVESASAEDLMPFVVDNIEEGSTVVTDGWSGYSFAASKGCEHRIHAVTKDKDALPHVHLLTSLLIRWLLGTIHGGISREQLSFYLDEYVFRFNRRTSNNRILIFHRA